VTRTLESVLKPWACIFTPAMCKALDRRMPVRHVNVIPHGVFGVVYGWPHHTRAGADAIKPGKGHGYRIKVRVRSWE